jgi:predicted permease
VRQLLTESTLLAVLGGAAGLAVAFYLTAALPRLIPEGIGFALDIAPDGAVLAFATVLALLTGTLFGLAPALQASRADIRTMLSGDGVASRRSRLRSAFLGGQVALAMALLIVSALFIRGLEAARAIDPGFDSTRVLDLEVDLGLRNYDVARGRVFQEQILERIRALADVEEATIISTPPLVQANSGTAVMPATAAPDDRSAMRGTTFTEVAPGYLEFARIPLVAGRALETRDADGAPAVAVVNESFARMLFDGTDVAGRSFRIAGSDALTTIVGVVRDTKYKSLNDRDEPFMYLPIGQRYDGAFSLQVRVRQDTPAAREAIRAAVLELDGALPLGAVRAATERMAVSLLPARLGAALVGTFGTLALLLAAVGVYGVTAYLVGRRTVEIGVRVALGATGPSVLRLLMGETLRVVGIGAAVGVAIGVGIGAVASSQLHGVGALDPIAVTSAFATLVAVAALGTWWPSRRALRGDPMSALRAE